MEIFFFLIGTDQLNELSNTVGNGIHNPTLYLKKGQILTLLSHHQEKSVTLHLS